MATLLAMLPFYLIGNLHCLGMCGPLVMMIGHHRYQYFYFLGRTLSFTLAGMIAGEIGAVANLVFNYYQLSAWTSFLFGGFILMLGIFTLSKRHIPGTHLLAQSLAPLNQKISLLLLRDQKWPTFLFGLLTIALPCGQSLIVFSACALSGSLSIGMVNGLCFALLTSPSLFFAMKAHLILAQLKSYYTVLMGTCAIFIGSIAICRGLADLGLINHLVWDLGPFINYHFVFY